MTDLYDDFVRQYGERPDKRSTREIQYDIERTEQRLEHLRTIKSACECYDSVWEGFTFGIEIGKHLVVDERATKSV